jgi:FO synthase
MAASGPALDDLLALAAAMRDRGLADAGRPRVITYSRMVFIPLTRLCRDRCHYCTFVAAPADVPSAYLSPDEVREIARAGAAAQCKEALFTLGDRPEDRWPQARAWLDAAGYASTLDYLRAMAVLVLEETGLLPHLNPGVMSWQELLHLKPVAPSMGMMLETTSNRLWSTPGALHHGSPDKEPAVRLRVLDDAGRLSIPFTTGVLVGIGETRYERAESLLAIRSSHRANGDGGRTRRGQRRPSGDGGDDAPAHGTWHAGAGPPQPLRRRTSPAARGSGHRRLGGRQPAHA